MGPCDLDAILAGLPEQKEPGLLSSVRAGEDAGVFLLSDDLTLVQTVDFFPPIVDDPYLFGQIAAANALSDIYAMGARPLTAMNIVAFPCALDLAVIGRILSGGQEKIREAGAVIVGGHTVEDEELKYGLAVTGVADPKLITEIAGARPGDGLVLTKPLGTGILATALKAEFLTEGEMSEAVLSMCSLNRDAASIFAAHGINACTDVTGFGLIGHLLKMLRAGSVSAEVWACEVPLLEGAFKMASMGMVPAFQSQNREYALSAGVDAGGVDTVLLDCLFDPQTSGGLLASVPPERLEAVVGELRDGAAPRAAVIGVVTDVPDARVSVSPRKRV